MRVTEHERCIFVTECNLVTYYMYLVHSVHIFTSFFFILQGKVKLSEYGLYYMTEYGADVAFPIGSVTIYYSDIKFCFVLEKHKKVTEVVTCTCLLSFPFTKPS